MCTQARPSVLVVESDAAVRELLADVLCDAGFQVQLVAQPEHIRRHMAEPPRPDLLVVELSPTRACRTLSLVECLWSGSAEQPPPVIACATDAHAFERLAPQLQRIGCSTLLKPFDIDQLVQLVRTRLAGELSASNPVCG